MLYYDDDDVQTLLDYEYSDNEDNGPPISTTATLTTTTTSIAGKKMEKLSAAQWDSFGNKNGACKLKRLDYI